MKIGFLVILAWFLGVLCGAASVMIDLRPSEMPIAIGSGPDGSSPTAMDVPHAEIVGENDFGFGVMEAGERGHHGFTIRNTGTAPLDLKLNNKSCKCTEVLIEPSTVPPGQEGQVILEWKTAGASPEFRHGATIETTDPTRPMLEFTIHGTVQQLVQITPPQLVFGDLTTHQTRKSLFSVYSFREKGLRIKSHDWEFAETAAFFTATMHVLDSQALGRVPNAISGVEVEVEIKPGLPIGEVRQAINLHTSAEPSQVITVPIHARVVGDVNIVGRGYRAAENILLLGQVRRDVGKRTRLLILVKGPYRKDFTVRVVETVPDGVLRAEAGQGSDLAGGAVRKIPLDVWIDPGAPPVSYLGTKADPEASVVLETSHPDAPRLEIRVRFATIE